MVVAACPFPAPRGTPIRILRLAESLAARGHHIHIVTYHNGIGDVPAGLTVHRIPRVRTYQKLSPGPSYQKLAVLDPLLAFKVSELLRRYRPDVIHAHHYEGLLVSAAARIGTGTPLVYDAHTMLSSELPFYSMGLPGGVKRGIAERFDRWLPRWADHVTTVTDRIANKLVAIGAMPREQVTMVPNGVELERFAVSGSAYTDSPGTGGRTLIFTGNLAPYQGIDLMLKAFQKVRERQPDVRLTIAAQGSSFEPYESLARELGVRESVDVIAADFEQVPELLFGADVALNPRAECDGIPLKLLNYLAAAKPVVSFEGAAPGLRHGQSAWLVPDGDVDAFAEGALTLLADPPLGVALGWNGRRHVEANHSWFASAERAEAVFTRLTSNRAYQAV